VVEDRLGDGAVVDTEVLDAAVVVDGEADAEMLGDLKFHECERKRPSKNIESLLDYLENSGDPIFWG